ncbi:hypothetical protein EC968_004394 [Mortierella alpina]|nr:hypothetical protein EC968_004394 [Mortierella alpina]
MADPDVDAIRASRSLQDAESTTVEMTDMGSASANPTTASVEYPNSFQQSQQQHQQQQQQHYSIHIPTINHWPTILFQHMQKGVRLVRESLQLLRDKPYHSVPSSNDNPNPFHRPSFRSTRHTRQAGHSPSCSGRRLSRIVLLLTLFALTMTWVLLPKTLKPFQDRDVWVRFFDHEQPVKIVLPYRRKVHVYDVKKHALQEMDNGYTTHNPENVRLLAPYSVCTLQPDDVWDNFNYYSSARFPIIAISTGYGCFSEASAFGNDVFQIKFQPRNKDFWSLCEVLRDIDHDYSISNKHIRYLRQAFNDPLMDASISEWDEWVRPKANQPPKAWYVYPTRPTQAIPAMPWPEWNSTLP